MRVKSAYRKYRDGGAVMADDITPLIVPTGAADVPDELEVGGVVGEAGASNIDDASDAFKAQINHLLRAEEAQRQRAAAPPQQPTRAERLNKLRQEGLSQATVNFLAETPEIMDTPQLADQAAQAARNEGHKPDTPEFFQSVRSNFHRITAPAESDNPEPLNSALET